MYNYPNNHLQPTILDNYWLKDASSKTIIHFYADSRRQANIFRVQPWAFHLLRDRDDVRERKRPEPAVLQAEGPDLVDEGGRKTETESGWRKEKQKSESSELARH